MDRSIYVGFSGGAGGGFCLEWPPKEAVVEIDDGYPVDAWVGLTESCFCCIFLAVVPFGSTWARIGCSWDHVGAFGLILGSKNIGDSFLSFFFEVLSFTEV